MIKLKIRQPVEQQYEASMALPEETSSVKAIFDGGWKANTYGSDLALRIAERYSGNKYVKTGKGYQCCCPVHGEDPATSKPSLFIYIGSGGDFFWNKHYGISFKCFAAHCPLNSKTKGPSPIYRILLDAGLIEAPPASYKADRVLAYGSKRVVKVLPIPNGKLEEWLEVAHSRADFLTGKFQHDDDSHEPMFKDMQLADTPTAYPYCSIDGMINGLVVRLEFTDPNNPGGKNLKNTAPLVWAEISPTEAQKAKGLTNFEGWAWANMGVTPPYGTEEIAKAIRAGTSVPENLEVPIGVILFEGEKKAAAASKALKHYWSAIDVSMYPYPIPLSGRSGSGAAKTGSLTDWSVLEQLKPPVIWLWPDNDEAGYHAFVEDQQQSLGKQLAELAESWGGIVRVIDMRNTKYADLISNKWDIADYNDTLRESTGLQLGEFLINMIREAVPFDLYQQHKILEVCAYARTKVAHSEQTGGVARMNFPDMLNTPCANRQKEDLKEFAFHPCRTMCHLPFLGIRRPADALQTTRLLRDMVLIASADKYADLAGPRSDLLTTSTFNKLFTLEARRFAAETGNVKNNLSASEVLTNFGRRHVVNGIGPALGKGPICADPVDGSRVILNRLAPTSTYNIIRDGGIDHDVLSSLDRILRERVTASESDAEVIRCFGAALVRHALTGERFNRWLYLSGPQGTGKDTVLNCIKCLFPANWCMDVDMDLLESTHFSPALYALIHFQDAQRLSARNYERLKKFLNPSPMAWNEKNIPIQQVVPNASFVFTSNHLNLELDWGDRRITVVSGPTFGFNPILLKTKIAEFKDHYRRLMDAIDAAHRGGAEGGKVKRTLLHYWENVDLSNFNWHTSQDNDVKSRLSGGKFTDLEQYIIVLLEQRQWPVATGLVCPRYVQAAFDQSPRYRGVSPTIASIKGALLKLGFEEFADGIGTSHTELGVSTGTMYRLTHQVFNRLLMEKADIAAWLPTVDALHALEQAIKANKPENTTFWNILTTDEYVQVPRTKSKIPGGRWCPHTPVDRHGSPHKLPDAITNRQLAAKINQ